MTDPKTGFEDSNSEPYDAVFSFARELDECDTYYSDDSIPDIYEATDKKLERDVNTRPANQLEKLDVDWKEQDISFREALFKLGICATWVCIVANIVLATAWTFGAFLSDNSSFASEKVVIAFISSFTIEVIGLVAIIAKSLFPLNRNG